MRGTSGHLEVEVLGRVAGVAGVRRSSGVQMTGVSWRGSLVRMRCKIGLLGWRVGGVDFRSLLTRRDERRGTTIGREVEVFGIVCIWDLTIRFMAWDGV